MQDEDRVKGQERQNSRQRVPLHWARAAFSPANPVGTGNSRWVDSRFSAAGQPDHLVSMAQEDTG